MHQKNARQANGALAEALTTALDSATVAAVTGAVTGDGPQPEGETVIAAADLHDDDRTAAEIAEDMGEDTRTDVAKILTSYYFEEALAPNYTERKADRSGGPITRSRRLARVHFRVGEGKYELGATSTISAVTLIFPDGTSKKEVRISQPGAMVGDDTWIPSICVGGKRNATDPEMREFLEAIRVEWMAQRTAAVKNGTAAMASRASSPQQVNAETLAALGLDNFDDAKLVEAAIAAPKA